MFRDFGGIGTNHGFEMSLADIWPSGTPIIQHMDRGKSVHFPGSCTWGIPHEDGRFVFDSFDIALESKGEKL